LGYRSVSAALVLGLTLAPGVVAAGHLIGINRRGTAFLFTGLNTIIPTMIAEATRNARDAAEQFALDSGSKIGAVRRASQGFFTITSRDANTPHL
jgi:hypothetical protein